MLATIGIVDCIFRRVGLRPSHFHSCVWGTAVLLPFQRGGTERKRLPGLLVAPGCRSSMKVHSPSLQASQLSVPHFERNVARVSESRAIFTINCIPKV